MQGFRGLCAIGRPLLPLHVQRDPLTDVLGRPHRIDALLRLAIAPVTSFYCIGSRRQELVISERQRLLQIGARKLVQSPAQPREPAHVPPELNQASHRRLGPAPSVEQPVDLLHDRAQGA
jgi:hypothetical protein